MKQIFGNIEIINPLGNVTALKDFKEGSLMMINALSRLRELKDESIKKDVIDLISQLQSGVDMMNDNMIV